MNTNVEELLREGMERFTAGVTAPAGLVQAARQHRRRRRLVIRTTVACTAAAATAVAAVVVTSAAARPASGTVSARTVAYVVGRVRHALATENMVYRGQTMSSDGTPSTTWVYGPQNQWIEYKPDGTPYSAEGTAIVNGRHYSVYVLYPDRKWTGSPGWGSTPPSACSRTGALGMGGIPVPASHWSDFISATLACGAASVTGHVLIDGVETTQITGKPITVRLSGAYSKAVHEKWARAEWTLYVDPHTYLPVRITGSTETFGGSGGRTRYSSVTDVRWLPPTAGNIARTLVTVPAGFQETTLANV
ncbi:MAG: hypothetical protein ACM32E_04260 [Gemmatimonadota bacterium]